MDINQRETLLQHARNEIINHRSKFVSKGRKKEGKEGRESITESSRQPLNLAQTHRRREVFKALQPFPATPRHSQRVIFQRHSKTGHTALQGLIRVISAIPHDAVHKVGGVDVELLLQAGGELALVLGLGAGSPEDVADEGFELGEGPERVLAVFGHDVEEAFFVPVFLGGVSVVWGM